MFGIRYLLLVLAYFAASHVHGIETVHPRSLHRIKTRTELVEFLRVAAEGGQLGVLSYEVTQTSCNLSRMV